ncbi:MAG: 16S rRNA (cytosine(1402)-N(4))-methyltransferase, partial [Verrucomicrobia bacterium]|nr:16S rRNA (cytosine(1402)-N(4))-methyltransferase [Verrucomicrobiota bacterium]
MDESATTPHRRRPRYPGKNPRRFEHKYKELDPNRHPETIAKVLASGKTPAGSHVPIMVAEIIDVLQPQPGNFAVDCTLGHGGHARAILERIIPGGHLIGLDVDPLELPRTENRLRVSAVAEGAIDSEVSGARLQDVDHLANHDWNVGTGGRFAGGEDLGDGLGMVVWIEFLVFVLEAARIFPRIAGTA